MQEIRATVAELQRRYDLNIPRESPVEQVEDNYDISELLAVSSEEGSMAERAYKILGDPKPYLSMILDESDREIVDHMLNLNIAPVCAALYLAFVEFGSLLVLQSKGEVTLEKLGPLRVNGLLAELKYRHERFYDRTKKRTHSDNLLRFLRNGRDVSPVRKG